MNFQRLAASIAVLLVTMTATSRAAIINAGFETGNLSGWSTNLSGGAANVVMSNSTTYPNVTYNPVAGQYFLAVQSGTANQWQEVYQSITLGAGGMLSGYAAFDWGDYNVNGFSFIDGAKVEIRDSMGNVIATPFYADGNLFDPGMGGSGSPLAGFNGPWTTWSWTAPAAGTYTLVFAARNTGDSGGPNQSFGLFDAEVIVPEPASMLAWGLIAGVGAVGYRLRKRQAKVVA